MTRGRTERVRTAFCYGIFVLYVHVIFRGARFSDADTKTTAQDPGRPRVDTFARGKRKDSNESVRANWPLFMRDFLRRFNY